METYQVRFLPGNLTTVAAAGMTLAEAARQAGLELPSPCGGKGSCGKCTVWIISGDGQKECLACRTIIESDLTVRIPEWERDDQILMTGTDRQIRPDTGISVIPLEIPEILPGQKVSVWEQVQRELAAVSGKASADFTISLAVTGKLYQTIKSGGQRIYAVLAADELLDVSVHQPRPALFAVDLGTTTLAGYLLDAESGRIIARVSCKNPQAGFGADVITRADYVLAHDGREMAACIRSAVDQMAADAAAKANLAADQIYQTVIVGNTCMHHLFLELSPESLVQAPYSPLIHQGLTLPVHSYLEQPAAGGKLILLPVIAGFVGADTTACLLSCDFEQEERLTLLIDIGTNGELVLGNKYRMAACSTAAGPAFEGARIECGMRGVRGAIEHAVMKGGKVELTVIGDCEPTGICGSGLMDIVAILIEHRLVDSMGMLQEPSPEGQFELYHNEKTGHRVYLSQKDIGEVQLAKAAMAAGIRILCRHLDVQIEQIEQVLIAGAFGNYMNPDSACQIGLIPAVLRDRIQGIGNAAGAGAVQAALSRERRVSCERLAEAAEFVELAAEPDFSDIFIEELEFPDL